jgi:4-amino-4-deoxy-L-arabinose transferase-like glycosyltransferase
LSKHALPRPVLYIFLAALSLRLAFVLTVPLETLAVGDQADYAAMAENLVAGGGFAIHPGIPTPDRAPGYPVFVAAVYAVSGNSPRAALIAQSVLSALTCLLLFWILRETLEDENVARLGAGLLAFYPVLIVYCGRLLSETLFTFLVAASMLLLARHLRRGKPLEALLAGLVMGAATLVRPGALLMPWLVLGLMLLYGRSRAVAWLGYAAVFFLTLVPWTMRNQELFGFRSLAARGPGFGLYVTGHMTRGMSYEAADRAYYEVAARPEYRETAFEKGRSPQAALDQWASREGKELIFAHPLAYARIVAMRLPRFWITSHSSAFGIDQPVSEYRRQGRWSPLAFRGASLLIHAVILALAGWGALILRDRWRSAVFLAAIPLYMNIHISFDLIPRYHLPAMPYILGLAAVPLLWRVRRIFDASRRAS